MAAELKESLGIELELIPGGGGIFDVVAQGKLVYSKSRTGRFPEHGEVTKAITSLAD